MGELIAELIERVLSGLFELTFRVLGRPMPLDATGFRSLRAGWKVNFLIVVSTLLCIVFIYAWYAGFTNGQHIESVVVGLTGAGFFGFGAFHTFRLGYYHRVEWNEEEVRIRSRRGITIRRQIKNIVVVRENQMTDVLHLSFDCGYQLRLSSWMRGTNQLVETIRNFGQARLDVSQ